MAETLEPLTEEALLGLSEEQLLQMVLQGEVSDSNTGSDSTSGSDSTPAPVARAVRLRRQELANSNYYALRSFRLRVTVAEVYGDIPKELFVFRRHPLNPTTGETLDEFATVASVADLAEYPVGQPDPAAGLPFFRRDSFEVDVRSTADAESVWSAVQQEVAALVAALNRLDTLAQTEDAWIGTPPDA